MPETTDPRVRVLPGDHVVVRRGRVVALLGPPGPGTVALRDALRDAADAPDPAEAVAGALEGQDPAVPAVALVTGMPPEVVMTGDVDVRARSAVGELHLNAASTAGVVRQPLLGEFSQVRLGSGEVEPDPWVDLEAGAVLGGGVVVALAGAAVAAPVRASEADPGGQQGVVVPTEPGDAHQAEPDAASGVDERPDDLPAPPAAAPPAAEAPVATQEWSPPAVEPLAGPGSGAPSDEAEQHRTETPAFTAVSLVGAAVEATALREPLPVAKPSAPTSEPQPDSSAEPGSPAPEMVEGLNCGRGHFNHPHAANCAWCGLGMLQVSHVLVHGPRPPLGVLVVDEQATFTLDAGYVIGRRPSLDPAVDGVRVRELVLSDPDRSVSRVHAAIRLEGWEVLVEDRGSGIGTWVLSDSAPPEQLRPGQPRPLRPGEHVHVGPHRLTFHSHHLR